MLVTRALGQPASSKEVYVHSGISESKPRQLSSVEMVVVVPSASAIISLAMRPEPMGLSPALVTLTAMELRPGVKYLPS